MIRPLNPDRDLADRSASVPVSTPVEPTPTYDRLQRSVAALGLDIYGGFHPTAGQLRGFIEAAAPDIATGSETDSGPQGTLILLGTAPSFWPGFVTSPEYHDGRADPVDRWSSRVIGDLAQSWGAIPAYPFTGPPYAPFVDWALASGRSFTSPSQMLVHDRYGMMISFRGALYFAHHFDLPPAPLALAPCLGCEDRPCLSRCPVTALKEGGPYDLAACHRHLESTEGPPCLSTGCLARRACPLSTGADRIPAQSAHHMRYFHIK
ncbi:ferredoxin [Phaeobacter sp. JH20_02]|uniref:ferredoxin n=1 Tax=unclassified Phaeobacter TaxID=2621772 RepID=UPI003A89036B